MTRLRIAAIGAVAVVAALAGALVYGIHATDATIDAFETTVKQTAPPPSPDLSDDAIAALPAPVRRYVAFVFPDGVKAPPRWVSFRQAGDFRRPRTEGFQPTTARQVIATATPDLVFSAETPIWGPVWAIAYDAYIDGKMEMRARLLSTVSVMHETGSPALDRMSLRRWLLETPSNPYALLPGGPVRWQPIDDDTARAVVEAHGHTASLVATFDERGALIRFQAEQDGDLTTPYHGSGEHVTRGDYRLVEGVRIPMTFEVARMADGVLSPFWTGRLTDIDLGAGATPARAD